MPEIIPKGTEMMPRKSIGNMSEEEQRRVAYAVGGGGAADGAGNLLTAPPNILNRSRSVHTPTTSSMINAMSKPGKSALNRGTCDSDDIDTDQDDEEFFDCRENLDDTSSLAKWSSMDLTPLDGDDHEGVTATHRVHATPPILTNSSNPGPSSLTLSATPPSQPHVSFRRAQSMRETGNAHPALEARNSRGLAGPVIDIADYGESCSTTVLILVAHGGSVLDIDMETSVRKSDVTTFRGAFESIMRTHYPNLVGHVVIKCVPCPAICTEALAVLSSLSPYRYVCM